MGLVVAAVLLFAIVCAVAGLWHPPPAVPTPASLKAHSTTTADHGKNGPSTRGTTRAANTSPTSADWPIFRGDPALRGVAAGRLPDRLAQRWVFDAGGPIKSSAVIGGGHAYVGSDAGKVNAVDLATGKATWSFTAGDAVEAPPLLHAGVIYVGSLDGKLYALDAATGERRWAYATDSKIAGGAAAAPLPDGRTVIVVGSFDNHVHGVDAATGRRLWAYETGNYINAAPALAQGRLVVGGCDGHLHVIAPDDGRRLGDIELGAYIAASPAVDFPFAYVGHYGNEFFAVDLTQNRVAWKFHDRDFPFFSSPAVTDDRIVVGSRDRKLHCLARADGAELWQFRTGGKVDGSPVICGDRVVFGSSDGRLYVVSLGDGAEVWSSDLGADIVASPAVAGAMIVVGTMDGRLYGFGQERDPQPTSE